MCIYIFIWWEVVLSEAYFSQRTEEDDTSRPVGAHERLCRSGFVYALTQMRVDRSMDVLPNWVW